MILIADSGSTKTDWAFLENGKLISEFSSEGLNPYFLDESQIFEIMTITFQDFDRKTEVSDIFFYGAGCNSKITNSKIETELKKLFIHAQIEVESDMLGVARSVFAKKSGIAVILGTGSNSCLYDGTNITMQVGSFGYILGDEGSGSNIGKSFITSFLNNELPSEISKLFYAEFKLDTTSIIESVYRNQFPNRYLASFTKFMAKNIENQSIKKIVKNSFRELFSRKLSKYDLQNHEIAFVGSIAFHFSDILKEVADEYNVTINQIEKTPMKGLMTFHASQSI